MSRRFTPTAFTILALLAVGLVPLRPLRSAAQVLPLGDSIRMAPSSPTPTPSQEPRTVNAPAPPPAGRPLLDRPVSRTEYILGPADLLTLSIFGFQSEVFPLTVSPEGTVVIPTVGVARVGGLNIEQAEQEVARQVRRIYRDVEVNLTLAAVRSFKVFLVGDVPNPGVREATAVTRVSEIVPQTDTEGVIHRNVVVRRANGEVLEVDLAVFLLLGDLRHNPQLREGDMVQVPVIDQTISVAGTVAFPGVYDYRAGESLADIIHLANGGGTFPASAADTIRLMRFEDAARGRVVSIARADAVGLAGDETMLQPFDALFVPRISHFKRTTSATIEGEVRRPGSYPIEPNVTTVRELVEMAGGFTEEASLLDAVLRRQPVEIATDSASGLDAIPPELLSPDERRILRVTSLSDDRNVIIDFDRLFTDEGSAYDLTLEDGDRLHVPEHRNEITVLGAVIQPGILAFVPGQPIDYFVELAGGYSRRADRDDLVVLKARYGNQLQREEVAFLEPGDRIVVPFKEPRTFLDRVQTVEGVVSTVSGLVLTVIGLERIFDRIAN